MRVLKKSWMKRLLAILLVLCILPIDVYAENKAQDLGANPEYTVQYYAEVEKLVTKDNKETNNDLAVIDTRTTTTGKLPTNTSIDETYITLDGSGEPIKERVVEPIFASKKYEFFDAPNLSYVDMVSPATQEENSLTGRGTYDLVELWVLGKGKSLDSTDEDDWTIYTNPSELVFTNNGDATGENVININSETVIRLVYEKHQQSTTYSNDVQMFDYDITDGKLYSTSEGKKYIIATENGINSDENYTSGSTTRYAFGNANMGVAHQDDMYEGYNINRAAENSSSDDNIRQCHFGIVGKTLSNNLPVFNVAAPDIFSMSNLTGKNIVAGDWKLGFIQNGDSFTLSTVNNGSENVLTNLESLKQAGNHSHIRSNFFWPLDQGYTTTDGRTYTQARNSTEVLNDVQLGNSEHYIWKDNAVSNTQVPVSDEDTAFNRETGKNYTPDEPHNCYFGMSFSVDFTIEKGYIGPLEYLFFGDDDMWVYLDGKLICDIGGVHSSVGEYVDLWNYLGGRGNTSAAGTHKLDFFYTERGASGSSCYMYFTLPSVTERQQTSYGNLEVTKAVTGSKTDGEFDFTVTLEGIAQAEGIKNIYPYIIKNAKDEVKSSGYVIDGKAEVKMANGDKLSVPYLPMGATYTVTEKDTNGNYITSVNGAAGNVANGEINIEARTYNTKTEAFVNEYNCGDLIVSKKLAGTDPSKDDEFTFTVTLSDKTVTGKYGDMTFKDGVATFKLKGGESKKATGLIAGTKYTVKESDSKDYYVSSTGETGTIVKDDDVEAVFTNSRSYTEVTIKKVWKGYEGKIPESIEVQLYKVTEDGNVEYGDRVEISEENNWTYTWEKLDAAYDWTADEVFVPAGYDKNVEVSEGSNSVFVTVTNTLITGGLKVSKILDGEDTSEADEFPFKVTLDDTTINGTFGNMTFKDGVAEFTLKGGQTVEADGLPAGIGYTVEELDSKDYHKSSTGEKGTVLAGQTKEAVFTNSRTYKEVTITKEWKGYEGRIPKAIEVQLYKAGKAFGEPVVLSEENDWMHTWDKLDASYTWTADETEVPEGYEKSVEITEGEDRKIQVVVTNTLITGGLKVSKALAGEDADPEDKFPFKVTLDDTTINGTFGDMTFVDGVSKFTLKGGESVEATGIPVDVKYTVEELDSKDYHVTSTGDTGAIEADKVAEAVITNSRTYTELTVNKVWEGYEGRIPESIKVQLYKDGSPYGEVVELSGDDDWTYTWYKLDATCIWTVDEVEVSDDYDKKVEINGTVVTITNVLKDGNLVVSKTITGKDASSNDEFTFKVELDDKTINGTFGDMTFVDGVATFMLKGGERVVATGLPEGVKYKVTETDNLDYKLTFSEGTTGGIIKDESAAATFNNHRSFTEVTVVKVWDGYAAKIPETVKVQLYKDGEAYGSAVELSAENGWTYTWTKLDDEFKWTVDEINIPKDYDKVVITDGTVTVIKNILKDGNLIVNKTITGKDASYSDEFTFRVVLSDKTINGTFGNMTFVNGVAEFTLKGGESAIAIGLPSGVTYKVYELDGGDYKLTSAIGTKGVIVKDITGVAAFNNHKSYTEVTIEKVWEGYEGRIPESIKVQLYKDGEPYGNPVELSAANGWVYTWIELDDAYEWTADEVATPDGYEKETEVIVQEDGTTKVIVTNKLITGDLEVSKKVEGDAAKEDDVFKFRVTLSDTTISGTFGDMSFVDGVAEFELKGGETAIATGLPAGITYTVEEIDNGGYTTTVSVGETGEIIAGETAKTEFTNTKNYTQLTVDKIWDGYEGSIPESLKVQLYKVVEGEKEAVGDPVELTSENNWTYAWSELDERYDWTADEIEVPDGYEKVDVVQDGNKVTITNKLLTGGLVVNKTLSGDDANEEDEFSFKVTLSDKTISGEFGSMTFENGVTEFTLKGGESIEAIELPAGIEYVVKETNSMDYTVTYNGETGVIEAGEMAEATVNNYRSVMAVTVEKVWKGDAVEAPDSIEVQLYRDGEAYGDPIELSKNNDWAYTWSELDDKYDWTVDEVEVPEGYEKTIDEEATDDGVIITITNECEDLIEIPNVVDTGDNNHTMLYLAGLCVSGMILHRAYRRRRL